MLENIKKEIFKKIRIASGDKSLKVNDNTKLIGNDSFLDSNSLVVFILYFIIYNTFYFCTGYWRITLY